MVEYVRSWTIAGGYGVLTAGADEELGEFSTPVEYARAQTYTGLTRESQEVLVAGAEYDPRPLLQEAQIRATQTAISPIAQPIATTNGHVTPGAEVEAALGFTGALTPSAGITATPVALPLIAGAAFLGGRALIIAIRAIAGRYLTVGVFKALVTRFGAVAVKVAIGSLAFLGLSSLVEMGADDAAGLNIPKKRKRYSIGHNPRVRTLAKVAGHVTRMLKKHDKVIKEFLPKKKVTYGIPPAAALSAIEKKAIRG